MDWFERLAGFPETTYRETRTRLQVCDGRLVCQGAGRTYAIGALTLPSLAELRVAAGACDRSGRLTLSIVEGDVRAMHRLPENQGALFQVASQFNMLEMVAPDVTPEQGVGRYQFDKTQGPACAMAAGAATIYRNYLVPMASGIGQTADRQLNGLADLGAVLARRLGREVASLWTMRNGYALPSRDALTAIGDHLRDADAPVLNDLRGHLRVGLVTGAEVTDGPAPGPLVSQIFCSALPVAYAGLPVASWAPFARLVLDAAYEATLLAAVLNAERGRSSRLLLTRLGGGAFGNEDGWIDAAMLRALQLAANRDLDVAIVSYGAAPRSLTDLVARFEATARKPRQQSPT